MSALHEEFLDRLSAMPVVAILRGVRPQEVEGIADAIIAAGVTIIEVPLNSPDPFASITLLAKNCAGRALIGAGTVLSTADVIRCRDVGSQIVVSPNMRPDVIAASVTAGMISAPGCLTPTEAFAALEAGADAIKLFPGEMISPPVVKAVRAVLPQTATLLVVGGITTENAIAFQHAGASGFGVGGSIYRAGISAEDAGRNAAAFTQALSRQLA
jgi:2-dehydro-3-deoxyphosphogalactonate aldolase